MHLVILWLLKHPREGPQADDQNDGVDDDDEVNAVPVWVFTLFALVFLLAHLPVLLNQAKLRKQKNGWQKNGDKPRLVFIFLPAIFLLSRSCPVFLQIS
jgi:hypothetical protein